MSLQRRAAISGPSSPIRWLSRTVAIPYWVSVNSNRVYQVQAQQTISEERYKFVDGSFVANDTYASDASSFQILTGVSSETAHLTNSKGIKFCLAAQHVRQDNVSEADSYARHHESSKSLGVELLSLILLTVLNG